MNNIEELIDIAHQAGNAIMTRFDKPTIVSPVSASVVTDADLLSHEILNTQLSKFGIPILSEEAADVNLLNQRKLFVVDPLDGTKGFIEKRRDFSVMIALLENAQPIAAVLYEPANQLTMYATHGTGAWMIDHATETKKRIHVSSKNTLKGALCYGSVHRLSASMQTSVQNMNCRLEQRGGSGVKIGLVSRGVGDFTVTPGEISVWDICAPALVLTESGGKITDLSGQPLNYTEGLLLRRGILASNHKLHKSVLDSFSAVQ